MEPMFLPEVEHHHSDSPRGAMIREMRSAGVPVPQILHLFAYKPEATEHLERFTQAVLRGPSPLSPGLRELIAAYTSKRNACPF